MRNQGYAGGTKEYIKIQGALVMASCYISSVDGAHQMLANMVG